MLKEPELSKCLSAAPTTVDTRTWFRQIAANVAVQAGFKPLAAGNSKLGRYHMGIDALYLSDSPETANHEMRSILPGPSGGVPVPTLPFVMFSIRVVIQRVINIHDDKIYSSLQTSYQEVTGHWQFFSSTKLAPTQALGMSAYGLGIEALLVPSAMLPTAFNLVVFPECLIKGSYIETIDPSMTFPQRIDGLR